MSKGNTTENDYLKLIYNATAVANIADNAATAPLTNIYVALHTAWPGEGGDQAFFECNYTSYARVAVARTTGGWTVTANSVSPVAEISFPQATGGSNTAMFFSTGVASSGNTKILHMGPIGSGLGSFTAVAVGDTITIPGLSGVAVNDRITFLQLPGSNLPTGMTVGDVYYVKTVSGNDITVSTTQGGATLDLTAAGSGAAYKVTPLTIAVNTTPKLTTATAIVED